MTLTDYLLSPERENAQLGLTMAAHLLTEEEIFNAVFEAFKIAYAEKERLQEEYQRLKQEAIASDDEMAEKHFRALNYNHPFTKDYNIKILHKFYFKRTDCFLIRALKGGWIYPELIVHPSVQYCMANEMLMFCKLSAFRKNSPLNKDNPQTIQSIGYAFTQNGVVEHECVSSYSELIPGTNFFKVMHKCFCL